MMPARMVSVICVAAMALCAAAQDKPVDPAGDNRDSETQRLIEQARRIETLVEMLSCPRQEERDAAVEELVKIGQPAVPFIHRRIREAGAGVYLGVLERINGVALPGQGPSADVVPGAPAEFVPDNLRQSMAAQMEKATPTEKYLFEKMMVAAEFLQRGEARKAQEILDAIHTLESKVSFRDTLKRMRLACAEKSVQNEIVRAKLSAAKDIFETGDKIQITMVLENVCAESIEMTFASFAEPGAQDKGFAMATVEITEYDAFGGSGTISSNQDVTIDSKVTLEPGGKWEGSFTLDTMEYAPRSVNYKVCNVSVELRPLPLRRKTTGDDMTRKIGFPQLRLRIFPPHVDSVLKDPLQSTPASLRTFSFAPCSSRNRRSRPLWT
jgi:hypothetical protein